MKKLIIFCLLSLSILATANDKRILKFNVENKEINNIIINIEGNNTTIKKETKNIEYPIVWGDTLSKISSKYKISIDKIVQDNKIKDKDLIYAGKSLYLEISEDYYEKK